MVVIMGLKWFIYCTGLVLSTCYSASVLVFHARVCSQSSVIECSNSIWVVGAQIELRGFGSFSLIGFGMPPEREASPYADWFSLLTAPDRNGTEHRSA